VRADGAVRRLRSQGRWITNAEGRPVKLVGTCQDITERKRAEEQLRRSEELRARNEELQAFSYMVSHDLKAPLRAIAGYARELDRRQRDRLDERGVKCIEEIQAGVRNLDRLIEDLLRYSRLDVEPSSETDVDLAQLVEAILRDRQRQIAALGAEVSVDLHVPRVRTWERGLTQIVGKLKFLLSEGEPGWEEYRRNARETVIERFDIGGYVEKLRSIYHELASAK